MSLVIDGLQPSYLHEKYKLFELWGFAVHTIFLFFDIMYRISCSENSSYLPNQASQASNINCAASHMTDFYGEGWLSEEGDIHAINKMIITGALKADTYFNCFFGTSFSILSIYEDQFYSPFLKQIRDNWNKNIEPRLRKYARTILLTDNRSSIPHCQSCWLPLLPELVFGTGSEECIYGTEKDGSKCKDYCNNCYDHGSFTSDDTNPKLKHI